MVKKLWTWIIKGPPFSLTYKGNLIFEHTTETTIWKAVMDYETVNQLKEILSQYNLQIEVLTETCPTDKESPLIEQDYDKILDNSGPEKSS